MHLPKILRNPIIQWGISVTLSVSIMAYLINQVALDEIFATMKTARPGWIAVGLGMFVIVQLLRTLRTAVLLESSWRGFGRFLGVQTIYGLVANILPMGSGEVSYVVLLRRIYSIPFGQGTAALVLARLVDVLTLSVFGLGLIMMAGRDLPGVAVVASLGLAVLGIGGVLFLWLLRYLSRVGIKLPHHPLFQWITRTVEEVTHYLRLIQSWSTYTSIALMTFGIWGAMYGVFVANIRAFDFDFDLTLAEIMVVFIVIWPLDVLPIKGIANLGSYEGAWVIALSLLGVNQTDAIALAIGTHIISLGYVIILALVGLIPLVIYARRGNPVEV